MLPVVIINTGNPHYLKTVITQAKFFGNKTILIGDASNAPLGDHVDMNQYANQAVEFQRYYVHLTTNGYQYELFCLQRWFILLEFMKAQGLDKCLHLDSDVLLFW